MIACQSPRKVLLLCTTWSLTFFDTCQTFFCYFTDTWQSFLILDTCLLRGKTIHWYLIPDCHVSKVKTDTLTLVKKKTIVVLWWQRFVANWTFSCSLWKKLFCFCLQELHKHQKNKLGSLELSLYEAMLFKCLGKQFCWRLTLSTKNKAGRKKNKACYSFALQKKRWKKSVVLCSLSEEQYKNISETLSLSQLFQHEQAQKKELCQA